MVDVTEATFETEIVAKSHEVPVVVDLWADWCGPCKTLAPILEQVIDETDGQVALAKVDVDANSRLAESFNVQGIPAVFAIKDGKIAGQFTGAQPEHVVRQFVESLLPSADEQLVADLNWALYGPLDYAIVARKVPAEAERQEPAADQA